jgi:hypothetical protein
MARLVERTNDEKVSHGSGSGARGLPPLVAIEPLAYCPVTLPAPVLHVCRFAMLVDAAAVGSCAKIIVTDSTINARTTIAQLLSAAE